MALHPGENRGYRELMLTAEEARTRLLGLAGHLEAEPRAVADKAADALGDLLEALKPALAEHDLDGDVGTHGGGARIGMVRAEILDRFLERNQALRFAVNDLEHVTTLLGYLANLSEARGKKNLPELCRIWERKLRRQVGAVRKAAIELGSDPDEAIEPLDPTPLDRADQTAPAATSAGEENEGRTVESDEETEGGAVESGEETEDRTVESGDLFDHQASPHKKPLPGAAPSTTTLPTVAPTPGDETSSQADPAAGADASEPAEAPSEPEPPKSRRSFFRRG